MNKIWLRDYEIILRKKKAQNATKHNETEHLNHEDAEVYIDETFVTDHIITSSKGSISALNDQIEAERKRVANDQLIFPLQTKPHFKPIPTFEAFRSKEQKKDFYLKHGDAKGYLDCFPRLKKDLRTSKAKKIMNNRQNRDALKMKQFQTNRPQSGPGTILKSPNTILNYDVDMIVDPPLPFDIKYFPKEKAIEAKKIWSTNISELRNAAFTLLYADVIKLSQIWKKIEIIGHMVTYVGILLGLSSEVEEVKRNLFKEIVPLLTFFREVNPLTIPARRMRKASSLYEAEIEPNTETLINSEPCAQKLYRWILCIQKIIDILSEARQYVRAMTTTDQGGIDFQETGHFPFPAAVYKSVSRIHSPSILEQSESIIFGLTGSHEEHLT